MQPNLGLHLLQMRAQFLGRSERVALALDDKHGTAIDGRCSTRNCCGLPGG